MSLYVRLRTSFWSHRKTLRLRSEIGDAAFWIPPRLWCYAAEHQPDGDFSDFSAKELALLIGYPGDAKSMLEALQQAGLLDGMKLHDWEEHNGYHSVFVSRAKKAAKARWLKEKTGKKYKEKTRKEMKGNEMSQALLQASTSNASSMEKSPHVIPTAEDIYNAYPIKVGKPEAIKAISRCFRQFGQTFLLERTLAFSKARNGDKDFCPHPATWFNQQRFNDEPSTWLRVQNADQPKKLTYQQCEKEKGRIQDRINSMFKMKERDHREFTEEEVTRYDQLHKELSEL